MSADISYRQGLPAALSAVAGAGTATEIIFVSLENWDEIWRRNQFLCAGLVRRNPKTRILFVSLPRDFTNALRTGAWRRLFAKDESAQGFEDQITTCRPWKLLPNSISICRRFNDWLYRWQVRRAARKLGFISPLLWINAHWAGHLAGKTGEGALIYDVTDDWTSSRQAPKEVALTKSQDEALCRQADAVIVCSERLREMKNRLSQNVHLIPNGVDADHYARVLNGAGPLPEITKTWKHPVWGYTGTVHPERVNLDLVAALAAATPEGSVVMVGPIYLPPAARARLEALPNVILAGPAPYVILPDLMRAFDVCITPHLVSEFTESLNPIKLWEYLATGKPIVSTNVAGFRDYPQFVRVAHSISEFSAHCRMALAEDPTLGQARREEARKHSWNVRVEAVQSIIAALSLSGQTHRAEPASAAALHG